MTEPRRITSKYAGRCRICSTPFPAGRDILWQAGTPGATCVDAGSCARALTARAHAHAARSATIDLPPVSVDAGPIVAFLTAARARGLKYPKARFMAPDGRGELRLSIAGDKSRTPGALQVVIGEDWQGRIGTDGTIAGPGMTAALCSHLDAIAAAPAVAAKAYAAVTSRCSFCDLPLTDAGSVAVGYGPICAERYGLPHTPQGTPKALTTAALHEDGPGRDEYDGTEEYNARARRDEPLPF